MDPDEDNVVLAVQHQLHPVSGAHSAAAATPLLATLEVDEIDLEINALPDKSGGALPTDDTIEKDFDTLPIHAYKDEILNNLRAHQMVSCSLHMLVLESIAFKGNNGSNAYLYVGDSDRRNWLR